MKKKCIFPVALAAAMLVPLLTSAAGALNRITYTASYNNNGLTIGTDTLGGVTYATVSYEGLYNGGEPGMPSLPIDYLKFSVPYNATNFTVTATTRWASQNLNYLVYPCQSPWMIGSPVPPIMLPDTSAYYSGNSYPSQMAWIADEGFLAGENHIVTVAVMPFRYKHTTNSDVLSRAINCVVTLRYDLSDSLEMSPIVRNDSLLREEGYQLTQSMVVNPGQVKNFAPAQTINPGIDSTGLIQGGIGGDVINGGDYAGGDGPGPIDPPIGPPGVDTTGIGTGQLLVDVNYPYLIVTTPELKHAVRRIAALKQQKGYNVKVVTMDDVMHSSCAYHGDSVNGHIYYNDSAGVLRQFIRCYHSLVGTEYVLLAGKTVPYRYRQFITATVPTDLYFSELNADWSKPEIEKYPELYVGRITALNEQQISNYTDKLLRYELNPGRGDCSYLKSALYTEGHDMHKEHEVKNLTRISNNIYTDSCVMVEDTSGVRYPSGVDIVNEINDHKYGFLSLHNHGDPSGLITYGFRKDNTCPNDIYFRYLWAIDTIRKINTGENYALDLPSGNGLNNLSNKWYPSICYSIACNTMPFDTITNFGNILMNFGESFIFGKDYGGPAFLGNTRSGFIKKSSQLEESFFNEIIHMYYNIGKAEALSKFHFNAKYDVVNHPNGKDYKYFSCVHNLLGDPEFEIWTDEPLLFSNINVERKNDTINISGISEAIKVGYRTNNNLYKTKIITSTSTPITLDDASPNSTIMLYKHNYLPYIAPLHLQNEIIKDSQYIIANDVIAGKTVDANRTYGDVIIKNGVEYEIEASGTVTLEDGFNVEKGATFAVYPACF